MEETLKDFNSWSGLNLETASNEGIASASQQTAKLLTCYKEGS